MATAVADSYTFTPGTALYAGLPNPSGALITTLSLVNTSGSTQAANFVSPMLGMPFKQGDVPSGQYPQFQLTDNTPCPATVYSDAAWVTDGSMEMCGVFFRTPVSIAGSASLTINVKNGGSAPAASSRALSEVTASDLKVELTGVTNLSGVWTASLNTAITDASEIIVIGDGPAGKLWRIRGAFKQSGAAHGQLECYHYLLLAQNNAGGLSHIEYLPRVAQPWGDVSSPAAARRVVTCVLKSGATTLLTMTGHDTTETPGANIAILHYGSFYVCDTDGRFNFIQGGGTTSARPTVRVTRDKAKFVASRTTKALDTSLSVSSVSSVNYVANCLGSFQTRNLDSTGPSNFIGVIPEWACIQAITQAAVDERAVRVSALAAGGWKTCVRKSTTGKIYPVVDVQSSYTGLGTVSTSIQYGGSNIAGIQNPSGNDGLWSGDTNTSHRGSPHYYAYLITGEPQYLDMQTELTSQTIMSPQPGTTVRRVGANRTSTTIGAYSGFRDAQVGSGGTIYKGAGMILWAGGVRIGAWALRDLAQGLAIQPVSGYDGAGVKAYFADVYAQCGAYITDFNSQMPTSWRDGGFWETTQGLGDGGDTKFESPWMNRYMNISVCQASQIVPSTNMTTLRQHLSKSISAPHATFDLGCLATYRNLQFRENTELIDTIAECLYQGGSLITNTTGNTVTLGGYLAGATLTNGDRVAFDSSLGTASPMTGGADRKQYYVVNASGNSGQLSLTPGGSVVTVASSVTASSVFLQLASLGPVTGMGTDGTGGDNAIMLGVYEAARAHEACGDSAINSARVYQDGMISAEGLSLTSNPRYAVLAAYPV